MLFTIDPRTELSTYTLWRSGTPGSFTDSVTTFNTGETSIKYTDNVNAGEQAYYYQLRAINYCNQVSTISENIAGTIFLQTQLDGYNVNIDWTEYYEWTGGVESYLVERRFYNEDFEPLTTTDNTQVADESLAGLANSETYGEVCYRITALEDYGNNRTTALAKSLSNISCVSLDPGIRFEFDAFIPDGADNNTFGPEMDFIPKRFHFKIFNRWGNLVFSSKDPLNCRWNGRDSNSVVPEGVYRYQLEYENQSGGTSVLHGNVTVVRQ
jgi:gliding motility-associated-like protein